MLDTVIGVVIAQTCNFLGIVLHSRWIDRHITPPVVKPLPTRTPTQPLSGGMI